MSWQDREYAEGRQNLGRPGGDWRGLRPSLDNPMSWSAPLMRVAGVTVRLHIIFALFIIVQIVQATARPSSAQGSTGDLTFVTIWIGGLFLMVLLHEFGHVAACRWTGGTADEI